MIDIKLLRDNSEEIISTLSRRKEKVDILNILKIDEERRSILYKFEKLKRNKNLLTNEISKLKREKKNALKIFEDLKKLSGEIKIYEEKLRNIEEEFEKEMMLIPNIPHFSVPDGESDEDNVEVRKFGKIRDFDFEPLPHWEIGKALNLFDQGAAAKTTGSRFVFYKGLGARLERAIINFFLDVHTQKNGYFEVFPPFIVSRQSMFGVGQLPKFENDAFKILDTDYFLIPTAEVPVTNMYRNAILGEKELPIKCVAYSACFRSEAGSASRDTRGLIRQHQFNKVELVKFASPKNSYEELENLVIDAESVLKLLELPYRVVKVAIGDLGFQAAMKYDIEVWMPSYNKYVEISSCSNFESFQARRINIKYRNSVTKKAEFIHTLNGSGVAVGRTMAAIIENFQNSDLTINIPSVLKNYMNNIDKITL
ncbi:MAG: serine--tRNA ligase [Clostridiales bacterium]|jgi:seryl-tRNA synthetase|nr:serine--tRNA ligase [Clostridiales bacterium]